MKLIVTLFSAVLSTAALFAQPSPLQVRELTLSNGMTVWLNEDHSQPKVYGAVVVKAGAKDCPGTGIAHYFEHIMFKGTDRIGTVDYAAERPWLDSITAQYDRLSRTTDAAERAAIQQHINRLSLKAADYAIPNEFSRLISKYGGTGLNASTSQDRTDYYNTFLPQYISQWCWLNSERLLHPVFRLFQGELENVYEEKNRGADGLMGAYDTVMRALFKEQPYAESVLGTTENLKNPRLSDMEAFYRKYYVAPNMGLILSGDLPTDSLLPLLEQTFGRVPTGPVPQRVKSAMPPLAPGEQVDVRLPIPIVKAQAQVYRAPADFDADADALELANRLLSNEKAGMLDSLTNEHAVMAAGAMLVTLPDAGATALLAVPRIPFGSMKKALARCQEQVERLMDGDFTEAQLEQQRADLLLEMERDMETISGRAAMMTDVFMQGHSWQEHLDRIDRIRSITKADVVAAARRYYDAPFLTLRKKFGTDRKETLSQPGYEPVSPRHAGEQSAFAQWLDSLPAGQQPIRTVDLDADAVRTPLGSHATLFSHANPVNDIFTLSLRYHVGQRHLPQLEQLEAYLQQVGTDSLRKQQLESAWQRLGTSLEIEAEAGRFSLTLTGRDSQLQASMSLLAHFLSQAAADRDALSEMKQETTVQRRVFGRQKDDVLMPLLQYVCYGQRSDYLAQPTLKEVKRLTADSLLALFRQVQRYECDLLYVGTKSPADVAAMAAATLPLQQCALEGADTFRPLLRADEPTVYFYHVPRSRQNYVCSYEQLPAAPSDSSRTTAQLWARYVGGGMSGVLFQHVREFRSLAYSTQGILMEPNAARHADAPLAFVTITGTQADKTIQVAATVDSLLHRLPMKANNLDAARQELLNQVQNYYPSFRTLPRYVANMVQGGYRANPYARQAELLPAAGQLQVEDYQRQHVAGNRRVWFVIGDRKQTDLDALSRYGKVVELKREDIYR